MALHRRLLQDIAELQTNPYPNIALYMKGDNISKLTMETYLSLYCHQIAIPRIYCPNCVLLPTTLPEGVILTLKCARASMSAAFASRQDSLTSHHQVW